AWHVPGADGDTWAVLVHGRGGPRREAPRGPPPPEPPGPVAPRARPPPRPARAPPPPPVPSPNAPEAPASPDGRYHLGDTEWLDVEAAMEHAGAAGGPPGVPRRWVGGGGATRG